MVIALLLACVLLVALDSGSGLANLHRDARRAFDPVESGFASAADPVGRFFAGLPDVNRNQARVEELQRENAQLRRQLQTAGIDRTRSADLRSIGALASGAGLQVRAATVIDYGPSLGFEWTVRINAGADDGVRSGMTVIDASGLVGRVKETSAAASMVVLAIDPGSSIGVRDGTDGQLGLVTGRGRGRMSYTPLDPATRPAAGDLLLSGPTGATSYTPNLTIGTVRSVSGAPGNLTVSVQPAVDFGALDVLAVVLTPVTGGTPQ